MSRLWALVLAGGSGTRFWPASRAARPKQLLALGGNRPLLAATSARLGSLVPPERQLVITAERHADAVRALLPDVPPEQVVGEPAGRDTAAAIGLGARLVARLDPDATVVAMPSDHVVGEEAKFREHLAAAREALDSHPASVLVFGIAPDRPATGYGYLKQGKRIGSGGVFALEAFVEKPDLARAQSFVAQGGYFWNAGLFAFRPEALARLYDAHLPGMNERLQRIAAAYLRDEFEQILLAEFPTLPKVSIDYGVMEKAQDVLLMPMSVAWDDVGSWEALARLIPKDAAGNVSQGNVVALEARDNIVSAEEGLVAVLGVEGLIVVRTADATLVCRRQDAESVKKIVAELEQRGLRLYI